MRTCRKMDLDICVLACYITPDEFASLRSTNTAWRNTIDSNLKLLAVYYELPIFTTFYDLYKSWYWSANKLLEYAEEIQDNRLKQAALNRHAQKTVNTHFNNRYTVSPRSYERARSCYLNKDPVMYFRQSIEVKNYELAIYLKHRVGMSMSLDIEFRRYCAKKGLLQIATEVKQKHILIIIDQTSCTKEQAIEALQLTNNDVVNAIMLLDVL